LVGERDTMKGRLFARATQSPAGERQRARLRLMRKVALAPYWGVLGERGCLEDVVTPLLIQERGVRCRYSVRKRGARESACGERD